MIQRVELDLRSVWFSHVYDCLCLCFLTYIESYTLGAWLVEGVNPSSGTFYLGGLKVLRMISNLSWSSSLWWIQWILHENPGKMQKIMEDLEELFEAAQDAWRFIQLRVWVVVVVVVVICGFEDFSGDAGGAVMELTDDPQLGVMEVIIGPAFVTPPQKLGFELRGLHATGKPTVWWGLQSKRNIHETAAKAIYRVHIEPLEWGYGSSQEENHVLSKYMVCVYIMYTYVHIIYSHWMHVYILIAVPVVCHGSG